MTDVAGRLANLSREERALLFERLREKREGERRSGPRAREEGGPAPLSFAQQRLWFLDRLAPGSPLYNVPTALHLAGPLDPAVLAACFGEIVRRHEALRTRFEIREGGPVQTPEPAAPLPLPEIDLSGLPADLRAVEEERRIEEEARAPFDLTRPPHLRARLVRLGPDEHLLLLTVHHIASDAWSIGVAVGELVALYPAFAAGRPSPLPELPVQYADFAREERERLSGDALAREVAFWRGKLAGAEPPGLPTDRPRPAVPRFGGEGLEAVLPRPLDEALRALAQARRATLFMAVLAPFSAFLARITGRDDIVLGTTVTGRGREEVARLIGFFVNTLVLRTGLGGDPEGREILARARATTLEAFTHQEIPFEKLVDELGLPRDPHRPPLLRFVLQLLSLPRTDLELPGLAITPRPLPHEAAKFDLLVNVAETPGGLRLEWRYDTDLFDGTTIARLSRSFEILLAGLVEDPERRLSDLPLLTKAEWHQLAVEWNEGEVGDSGRFPIHHLFEAQVDRAPDAVAVSQGPERLTYRELDVRANRLARHLLAAGVRPGDLVALVFDRSLAMIEAILATLKAGAGYLPLDPAYPEERRAFALADSDARIVLTAERLEAEREAIAARSGERLALQADPELPAYVIYTSGSTGRPKGVVIPHGNVTRLFAATAPWLSFGPDDVWTLFHSYAFDFSVWEIWGALLHGGRLVVVPFWETRSPQAFYALLRDERVTILNQTPSAFRQLLWAEDAALGGAAPDLALRFVIFGGEALEPASLAPWIARHGDERPGLVNMYGITETTVHVTYRSVRREDLGRGSVIGRPIPDLSLHVLDRSLRPQPVGVPGEICVGGQGLALGYLGRPELTAERFVPDPFGPPGARLYRSGDLARRLPDGDVEYLGRIDHQVKIRGFRIELGEIEAALSRHPAVREAVVAVRGDRLVAWIVPVSEEAPSFSEIRAFLAGSLPEPMLPGALAVLDALPLTVNGKVDRRALPDPDAAPAPEREHRPPQTELERFLAGLFAEVLKLPPDRPVGLDDDFFELGGTSITGAILVNRLQEALGEIVHVVAIFDAPTVDQLAAYVAEQHPRAEEREARPAERPAGPEDVREMRRLIALGRSRGVVEEGPKNPPAVFVLSPPRSGSTLLRVMLGAHPRLFAPPELELLSFGTLAERRATFSGRDAFWLEGVTRAVMEALGCGVEEAERIVADREGRGWSTLRFYRELEEWIGDRLLVDKTPSYALDPEVLRRAEEGFSGALYLHLVRHPRAVVRSFEEAKLDQIFFRREHPFSRRKLAELIWTVSQQNILDFLAGVPEERRRTVHFEDLVRDPERVLAGVCDFLGVDFRPEMADPYRPGAARMTDGVHAVSRMLGDVKLLTYSRVDPAAAEHWLEEEMSPLGGPTLELAAALGYGEGPKTAPLSFSQERLWFLDQLMPGVATYNLPTPFRLRGPLDLGALARSFGEIVRRHEALRTRFEERDGTPVQVIDPPRPWALPVVDLTEVPEEALRLTAEEAGRPFDLQKGPLLRTTLLRLSPEDHGLLVNAHHIVTDGWSVRILSKELVTLYEAFAAGRPSPLPELPAQYADFARWQRERLSGAELERQVDYWRARLGDDPPALDLPLDRPRPALQTYRGASVSTVLPRDLSERIRRLGLASRASLFMTLLAGFEVLLHRQSGQDDILVGTPVAGRVRSDVEDLIGFFLNTLVLRTDLSGHPSFRELLLRVRETAVGAYAHQEVPFEKLLGALQPERDLSRTPLFQVFFNLANFPDLGARLPGGLTVESLGDVEAESKFDLTVYAAEAGDGIRLHFVYNADLFDAPRIEEMLRQYRAVLERVVEDPEARVDEIPLVTPEAAAVLPDPRAPLGDEWRGAVHELFLDHARRHPERLAVSDPEGSWTYGELARAVDGLAARLREAGVEKGDRVAVWAHRSAPVAWAVLGTLRAGGAFVMLDPAYPAARIVEMLRLAGPRAFLQIAAAGEPPAEVEAWLREAGTWRLTLRRGGLSLPETAPKVEIGPDDLAYIAFTSGSTGVPKGILGRHGPLSHFIPWQAERFGLSEEDRYSLLSGLAHDPLQRDLFTPLATGASLAAPAPDDLLVPGRLAAWAAREGITVSHLTPALGRVLTEGELAVIPSLRWVLLVGDVLTRLDVDRLRRIAPNVTCVNLYGSTETQRAVAFHVVEDGGFSQVLPLGRGMRDVQLLVLRPAGPPALAGIGEVGEICVRSPHLAAGYLGDEAGTRERFRANPFTGLPGDRIYRTGDLGRYLPDGQVTFAGRADQQVKIRGFRIELGEIEAALGRLPGVKEAVVLALSEGEDRRLVAFVVGEAAVGLRQALAAKLPAYMVPSAFVRLERMPVTPNGKVDRRALAALKDQAEGPGSAFVPPRTPAEQQMAAIWAGVLGLAEDRVGVHDNFFELGGHSLLATRLASRVRAAFGADLPLRALFEAPTVAGLTAVVLAEAGREEERDEPALVRRSAAEAPLSFSQERLWFLERLTPGTGMYNLPGAALLRGPLDPTALARAFGEIVRRHETLRTRFEIRAGLPVQAVAPPVPWSLPLVDLSGLPESRREPERLAAEEAARPFDLRSGRLLRTTLLRLGPEEHALLVTVHHIASDGWSQRLLFRELAAGYAGAPLPELPVQYADYAAWQRERLSGETLERQLAFWRERLGDRPPPLDLPLDRPRPAIQTFRGAAVAAVLPRDLSERLQALSVAESASLFMVLLAGFELLLNRQSGQDDVVVGTPVAGRLRPEVEDLIGFFLNTLVLRTGLSGRPTFRELVRRVRETALSAFAHQDVPFERLLQEIQPERDLSRTPLFQVFFNMLNLPLAEARLPSGLAIEPLGTGAGDAKFDLTVYAAQGEEGIGFNLVYNADLFDEARMEELLRQYRALLAQAAERPDAPMDAISLVTPEAVLLLPDPRAPLGDAWRGAVHTLFAERARRHPERPAVTDPEGTTAYGELAFAVRRLAARLRESGVEKGDRVAIWAHRSAPIAWAVLATLEAGGAFVMLDPAYPAPRIVEMLQLAAPRAFLAVAAAGDPPPEVEAWLAEAGLACRVTLPGGGPRGARELVASLPPPVPPVEMGPDDLAYVAFTSGSTGTPKGILGRHGPLSHFLPWQAERFGLGAGDRYSLLSGLAHDPLQRDLFTPLCLGGSLAAPSFEEIAAPGRLAAWMAREGITVAHLTPALGQLLTEPPGRGAEPATIPSLRWVLLVGDVLTRLDVDRIRRIAPNVTCVNLYGSTETQRAVAYHVVETGGAAADRVRQVLPLGRGMEDVQLLVVRPGEEPGLAGVGEVGEIWVRSPHLAAGYLGDPELTGDRFRTNPWTGAPGDRVYRTGDLGRYLPDGEVAFAGRVDQQVKIRGFRIEPGEIEAALGRLPGVREAVVIARQDGADPADRRLVAYVVPDPASPLGAEALREALRARLPAYMVPAAFVFLEKLPVTPNRKVDRRALPAPGEAAVATGFAEPGSGLERAVAGVWREVLGRARVGLHDNFFDLGGHSLLGTSLLGRLQGLFGVELPLRALFEEPTVAGFVRRIEEALRAGEPGLPAPPPLVPVPREGGLPLSFAQQRLWFLDRLNPGSSSYNLGGGVRLAGRLDVDRLRRSLGEVVRRHETLRTGFAEVAGHPILKIAPDLPLEIPVLDLSGLLPEEREAVVRRIAGEQARAPFDLTRPGLLRVTLLRLAGGEHVLLWTIHHIVSDAWSNAVLMGEVAALYAGQSLPGLLIQYADFAVWQREWLSGEALERQLAYWREQLAFAPAVELPTDRPRPPVQTFRGATHRESYGKPLLDGVTALARSRDASVFMALLAAFDVLLCRFTGQEDVVVGSPIANRTRPELERLIGFFVNT
ncbi:MAG TPA: amino acid adenylation domain-containing protein, partial [Thermoanaerobaculia bacterium]|nr:amino acid adenylation domain-containing protein [Thermoanaerobaculia bacterium]